MFSVAFFVAGAGKYVFELANLVTAIDDAGLVITLHRQVALAGICIHSDLSNRRRQAGKAHSWQLLTKCRESFQKVIDMRHRN
jgi:hypothetical protein